MTVDRDAAVEALIHDGRRAYAAKHYKNALECFTRAMKRCPCARGIRRERCGCKDFEKVAAHGESIFEEAMYTCKCSVSQTFSKCDNALHIQALDYRAATFEALKELDRARKDAEWMLELSPRLPDGYLRLGKIARLQKKNEFAWKVFSAGIDAGLANNMAKSDPKMVKLYAARQPLHARFCRHDPLQMPIDIVHHIFFYVDFPSLLRCLQVCKAWRRSLTSRENSYLWKSLELDKPSSRRNPPNIQVLSKLLSYSGNDARRLVVRDAASLRLANSKLQALLRGSRKLEYLELHNEFEPLDVKVHQWPRTLTHLVLDQVNPPPSLWEAVAENIVYLDLNPKTSHPSRPQLQFPVLPNLRYLRIVGSMGMLRPTVMPMTMPKLEQLWFSNLFPFADYGNEGERAIKETFNRLWGQLKVVIVDGQRDFLDLDQAFGFNSLVSINRGDGMRHIELMPNFDHPLGTPLLDQNRHSTDLGRRASQAHVNGDELGQPNTFLNLETLRVRQIVMDGTALQPILRGSLGNNTLRHLDINFRRPHLNETEGPASCQHIEGLSWLRGSPSILSLRVSNFRFTRYPRTDEELPLPGFLATFPNLAVLEVGSEYYDDGELCSVIIAIMKATNLKKLYQNTIKGAALDSLRAAAREFGVQLVWGQQARDWPVPIED